MKYFSSLFAFLFLVGFTEAAVAEWSLDGGANLVYESNLSYAYDKGDRKADFSLKPFFSVGNYNQLTDNSRFFLSAFFEGDLFTRYERLNTVSGKITAGIKNKMGLGAYTPWITLYGSAGALSSDESIRDSFITTAGLSIGKRLHERVGLQAGYEYEQRASKNFLFTQNNNIIHLNLDFLLTDSTSISAGYALRRGDIAAYYKDDSYSPSPGEVRLNTFNTPMTAEKIRATTHSFSLTAIFALTGNASVSITGERRETVSSGLSYPDDAVRLGISYSY
ncbi:MAG: hypothetical protein PHD54_14495 [Desulfuromonadaceae bacterium]|nr:hypothetical protein [Desulfuromonadaceae bacterium]